MSTKINKIIHWIIDQQMASLDDYPQLVNPLAEEFSLETSCSQSIIDTIVEWETDPNTIDNLEELLNKRFPDIV